MAGNRKIIRRSSPQTSVDLVPIESGLDQPLRLPELSSVLRRVDDLVDSAIQAKNPEAAISAISRLLQVNRVSGLALARFLWKLSKRWAEFGMKDALVDIVLTGVGLSTDTTRRYIAGWESIENMDVDEETRDNLMNHGIKAIISIAQKEAKMGRRFSKSQLKRLARSEDLSALRRTLSELDGNILSERTTLVLRLRRDGSLEAWQGSTRVPIGFIMFSEEDLEDPIRKRVVDRLIESIGIIVD